jgi:cob(I)alamin adenosyltransferase
MPVINVEENIKNMQKRLMEMQNQLFKLQGSLEVFEGFLTSGLTQIQIPTKSVDPTDLIEELESIQEKPE